MSTNNPCTTRVSRLVGCIALLASGCSTGLGDVGPAATGRHGEMQAHFEAEGTLDTSCGTTAGVHLKAKGPGDQTTGCDADWIAFEDQSYIADCFFVVKPGDWTFTELSAIDEEGHDLSCCTSTLPEDVTVEPSETSEVGGSISCDNEQNGGLDVFVTINRPPVIVNVGITPSKFGTTCTPIGLDVDATDTEGDALTYTWEVITAPAGASYSLEADADVAAFASQTTGDYEVRVTAQDELGASAQLDFPLHIVDEADTSCDTRSLCLDLLDLPL